MPTRSEAEDNLRVIRSLMERATIYRAISAPVALVGGLASLIGCGILAEGLPTPSTESLTTTLSTTLFFFGVWMGVLAITVVGNIFFLWKESRSRGDAFLSPGMRAALCALAPCWLVAAILTVFWMGIPWLLPMFWMILYGLGLLATRYFAPRSIVLLGWAFVAGGLFSLLIFMGPNTKEHILQLRTANLCMGGTFGLFHLIYAACTWPKNSTTTHPGSEP
jgi:hypothetical protein